jgi:beta-glucanase (GH16 family)
MDKRWELVWSDEFDYSGFPDPAKWNYEVGQIRNQELQYYTVRRLENARVENHCLIIEGRHEKYEGADYTSASLHTLGLHSWRYGRIEMRAKLPFALGTWPAFWTLGDDIERVDWPRCGEIDIMEAVGFEPGPLGVYSNAHYGEEKHFAYIGPRDMAAYKPDSPEWLVSKGFLPVPDADKAFHVYAVEWREDRLDFYVDDTLSMTYMRADSRDGSWPYDKPHYLIVNLAIGGNWGGQCGVDASAFPQRYEIDYIRVYREIK